jgi:hypothetical protein
MLQADIPAAVKAEVCAEGGALHGPHSNSNTTGRPAIQILMVVQQYPAAWHNFSCDTSTYMYTMAVRLVASASKYT